MTPPSMKNCVKQKDDLWGEVSALGQKVKGLTADVSRLSDRNR